MSVLRPEVLLLLWLLPLVILLMLRAERRRRKLLEEWARPESLRAILPRITPGARGLIMILIAAAFGLAVIALSGVQYGSVVREYERRGVNIMVVLDCSRSMLAQDVSPDRLERSRREVKDLLEMLEGDKVGLVAFAGTAFLQCPLTLDYSGLHIFLDALSPDFLPVGGTDLALAIRTAADSFRDKDGASRAMIIISDGGEEDEEALKAAREAVDQGVLVYCLGVGTLEGAPVPDNSGSFMLDRDGNVVHVRLKEELLKQVALGTGGAYARSVPGDEDLRTLYGRILADLAAQTLEQGVTEIREDRYQWFLLGAMALLAAVLAIPTGAPSRRSLWARLLPLALLALLAMPGPGAASERDDLVRQAMDAYGDQQFEAARDAFLDAVILEPDSVPLLYNLGNTQYRLGNFKEAQGAYAQGLEQLGLDDSSAEPYSDPVMAEAILYNQGNTAYRLGDLPGAIDWYEQALALDPEDEDARRNLEFVRWMLEQQQNQQDQQNQDQQNQDQQQNQQQNQQGQGQNQDQQQDQQQDQSQQDQDQQDQQDQQNQQDQGQNQDQQQDQGQDDQQGQEQQEQQDQQGQDQQDQQEQQEQDQQDQGQDEQQGQEQQDQEEQQDQSQQDQQDQQSGETEQHPEVMEEQAENGQQPNPMDIQNQAMQDTDVDEAMLNRLEDKPGRALMPRVRRSRVEEDW